MLPYNIIDRRPIKSKIFETLHKLNIEIHTRSVFLQGLLLLNKKKCQKFSKWSKVFNSIDKVSKKIWNEQIRNLFKVCFVKSFYR